MFPFYLHFFHPLKMCFKKLVSFCFAAKTIPYYRPGQNRKTTKSLLYLLLIYPSLGMLCSKKCFFSQFTSGPILYRQRRYCRHCYKAQAFGRNTVRTEAGQIQLSYQFHDSTARLRLRTPPRRELVEVQYR